MRTLPALLLAACLAASLVALPANAQHNHTGTAPAILAHDTPANGRTYVGDVTSFAVVDDANHDLAPDVHQNNHIRVTLNGAVLWEASAAAGHDYDGVNTFSIVFPQPGAYAVELVDDMGMATAHFDGTVEAPHDPVTATLALDAPSSIAALAPATFKLQVEDAGHLLNHTDAIVEVRQGDDLVFRTHAHTHTEAMELTYAFPRPGTYTVRATGYLAYATGKGHEFAPVTAERTVTVGSPDPNALLGELAPAAPASAPVPDNIVVTGTVQGGGYKLFGTYDPYTVASPGTQMHLTGLVVDPATNATVQHVDFKATLTGPAGTVFSSQTLHEYDGIYEVVAKEPIAGAYRLVLDASKGDWKGHVELPYSVSLSPPLPDPSAPAPPAIVGPVSVSGTVSDLAAGKAATITLASRDLAGDPYQHSEVDVELRTADGHPMLWTKLHTHGSGEFPLTYAFPAAGDYALHLAASALDGTPANFLDGSQGASLALPVKVAAGPGLPLPIATASGDSTHAAPAAGLGILVALLGAALIARRR